MSLCLKGGSSMFRNLSNGWRQILTVAGSGAAVYLFFRFALPLVLPFVFAFLAAMVIKKPVRFLRKYFRIRESLGAGVILGLAGVVVVWGINRVGKLLIEEIQSVAVYLNGQNLQEILRYFTGNDSGRVILFGKDWTLPAVQAVNGLGQYFTMERCIGYCMEHSTVVIGCCGGFLMGFFVFFLASVLAVEEMENLHQRLTMWTFYREIVDFGLFIGKICGQWLRVQGLILLIVTAVSVLGLWITGFSCALLVGVVIGIVDMLPILGAGTIYLPWLIWEFIRGAYGKGVSLLVLYVICYLTRELMESKLMGKCMGITAFEFLAAVYVGLKLFGAAGFVLGPVGVLVIMWSVEKIACYGSDTHVI